MMVSKRDGELLRVAAGADNVILVLEFHKPKYNTVTLTEFTTVTNPEVNLVNI